MTSVMSAKPPNNPRLKRPPPAPVHTGINGTSKPSAASSAVAAAVAGAGGGAQSPSMSAKRPPSATMNGTMPGSAGTPTKATPIRRPSQKSTDTLARSAKLMRAGESAVLPQTRPPEPIVKTTEYILKKYAKKPPSLIIHLHPSYFRFEQQDGSFSYNSSMNVILKHVRQQTVPAEMVEELLKSNIPFYENCLIVQIHDHRKEAASKKTGTKEETKENQPFSIHKPNKFTVPSPYSQFPLPKQLSPDAPDNSVAASQSETEKDKAQKENSDSSKSETGTNVFTTVLFSTPTAIGSELLVFAYLADANQNATRRRAIAQKGASAAALGPPPAKRQKTLSDYGRLQQVESKLIHAMAPVLYLEPAESMDEVQHLLHELRDPLHCEAPPAPKSRKRTSAELAADEALFAEEQRYMLIMDERLQPSANTADGETGGANFEPSFERFKLIEKIRKQQEEKRQQEAEAEAAAATAEKEQRLQQAQAARRAQIAAAQQAAAQQVAAHQAAQQAAQQAAHVNSHAHPQNATTAAAAAAAMIASNAQQAAVARAQQASPATHNKAQRNASSPVNAQPMSATGSLQGGVPMALNTSRQDSGSPPRPGSAVQPTHHLGMNPPQQPPSRHGTPHLGGTPRMQAATPVMQSAVATPQMAPASSPAMSNISATPMPAAMGTPTMASRLIGTPQMKAMPMTAQQFQAAQSQAARQNMIRQQQQQQAVQQQMMARVGQGSPAMNMSQMNQFQLQQQQQQQQVQAQAQAQAQQQMMVAGRTPNMAQMSQFQMLQQQQQQQLMQQQMAASQAQASRLPGNMTPQQRMQAMAQMRMNTQMQGGMPGQGGMSAQGGMPGQQAMNQQMAAQPQMTPAQYQHWSLVARQRYHQLKNNMISQGGQVTAENDVLLQNRAKQLAYQELRRVQMQARSHQQQQQQQQQQQ